MTSTATSKNNKIIRLTDERWAHITEEHAELAGIRYDVLDVITQPDKIVAGNDGELLAIKEITDGKFLVVIYRETELDGFIITAFLTRRKKSLERRRKLWP